VLPFGDCVRHERFNPFDGAFRFNRGAVQAADRYRSETAGTSASATRYNLD
jgi:hypothetical protein